MQKIPAKICNVCGKEKFLIEFAAVKTCRDGFSGRCKECEKEYRKKHPTENQIIAKKLGQVSFKRWKR